MVSLSDSQPPFDEIDVSPRCPYPFRRFLLKGVKNIDHLPETYGVESAIGGSVMDRDDLENPRALPFPWLRGGMFPAELSDPKRSAYLVFHGFGKYEKVSLRRADPIERPFALSQGPGHDSLSHNWDKPSRRAISLDTTSPKRRG
jgi:hypothetical protein